MGKVKRELFEPQKYDEYNYKQDTVCLEEQLERAEFELEVAHKHWSWLRHKINNKNVHS